MSRFRDHQIETKSSFDRVKQKNRLIDAKIQDQEDRIHELEKILRAVQEVPSIRITKKRRNGN